MKEKVEDPASIRALPQMAREAVRLFRDPLSYLYLLTWYWRLMLRRAMARIGIPLLLLTVGITEFIGPVQHVIPTLGLYSQTARLLIGACLIASCLSLIVTQRETKLRIRKQSVLLASVGLVIEERSRATGRHIPQPNEYVSRILQTLAFVLEAGAKGVVIRTAVVAVEHNAFRIVSEFPSGLYQHTALDQAPGLLSYAETLLPQDVLYIPHTSLGHGIRVSRDSNRHYSHLTIAPHVLTFSASFDSSFRCAAAAVIAPQSSAAEGSRTRLMLFVMASKVDSFRELDFESLRIYGSLLADVFGEVEGRRGQLLWERLGLGGHLTGAFGPTD